MCHAGTTPISDTDQNMFYSEMDFRGDYVIEINK